MDFEVRHVDGTTVKLISSEHKCAITSATQTRKLCGNDTVTINLQSATYIEFQVGDKITIFGTTYTLNQLPTVKKESERSYTYTLVFEGLQYTLIDRVFLMPDNTQGDNLMFDLAGMLDVLDDNINRGNSGKQYEFVLDESLEETEYKNLSLIGKNCLQVLQQLCQEWDTEFVFAEEPTRIAIYIGVAGSTFAFPFTYGRGGGVYELNREKGASDICTRLFVYGGTQNLTYYRHNRLCLPSKEKNQSFVEDATAQAVYGIKEQVKNFDDIYPNRIGTITSLSGCDYNEFIDSAMADAQYGFDLNEKWANNADDCEEWLALKGLEDTPENEAIYYNDVAGTATKYLMAGATAKIHFNTGALAGYECDLHSYTHSSQKFVLKPLVDENGYDFPSKTNAAFKLAVGDEYVILDINLPTAYKEEAESKLATEAASYFDTVCRPQPKYTLTIEPIALKHIVGSSTADTEIFKVGDLINISDPTGGVESATIRIDQFVRNLLDPFDYKLTLTDEITYSQQVRTLIEVDAIKRVVEESKIYDVNRIRRGWKDAEELYNQMFDTEGHYYSEKIAPLSIDTQMLKVGARSQQLVLQNVLFQPNYNANPANLQISAGSLVHYTIAEPDIKTWTMSAYSGSNVPSTAQYVYAKCAKNGTTGTWLVTDQAIIFDSDPSYYHFLVGSLSSVDSVSNTRNFAATYGYTTINGRYITTGVIKSSDTNHGVIIDLDAGEIIGNIKFLSGGQAVDAETFINDTVGEAVSEIDVVGQNILRNSASMLVGTSGKANWRASGGTLTNVAVVSKPLSALTGAVRCTNSGSSVASGGMAQDYTNDTDRFKFTVGDSYIQSYYVRGHLSFYDSLPSSVSLTGCTYTYDESTDTYTLTSTISGDSNAQVWLQNAFREANYLYLSGKEVTLSVDITLTNSNNKPRIYLYDATAGGSGGTLWNRNLSQGHNEFTITFPTVASGHTVGLILRMHQSGLSGGSVAVGDVCTFKNLIIKQVQTYNYPQPIYQTNSIIPTTGRGYTYLTHQWQKVAWGGELGGTQADTYSAGYSYCTNMPVGGWFEICAMKLEKGTVATDWTPAPEDLPYDELVRNLTATCDTAAGTATKVIVCPEITSRMIWDSNLRIKIKFNQANTAETFEFEFRNSATGAAVRPSSGATTNKVRLMYGGHTSSYSDVKCYWVAGQEVEFTYDGIESEYGGGTSVHLKIVDESQFNTAMAFSKALQGVTTIAGGLILTKMIQAGSGSTQSGMSGLSDYLTAFFAGGSIADAELWNVPVVIRKNGDVKFGVVRINGGSSNGELIMPNSNGHAGLLIRNSSCPTPNTAATIGSTSWQTASMSATTSSGTGNYVRVGYIYQVSNVSSVHNGMAIKVKGGSLTDIVVSDVQGGSAFVCDMQIRVYNGSGTTVNYYSRLITAAGTYAITDTTEFITNLNIPAATGSIAIELWAAITEGYSAKFKVESLNYYYYNDSTVPQTVIGNDGFLVQKDTSNYFQAKEKTVGNTKVLETTIKGNTDIPGVLWAGTISSSGGTPTPTYKNAAKYASSALTCGSWDNTNKRFAITHRLGTSNFTAMVTPSSSSVSFRVAKSGNDTLYVYLSAQASFDLVLFGTN